jgi:hypothetical protein
MEVRMRTISLRGGYEAIVDDDDYERLSRYPWHADKRGKLIYARSARKVDGKIKYFLMHREVLSAAAGVMLDHRNRNGLDNRRENLRECTRSQNMVNKGLTRANTSGYCGATFNPRSRRHPWRATIRWKSVIYHLGSFATPEEAARAYDAKAVELHGEFACLNFPID